MGNLLFISANRAVSDKKFTDMLSSIVEENYSAYYEVIYYGNGVGSGSWKVTPKQSVLEEDKSYSCSLSIFRSINYNTNEPYKGKFAHKYMRGEWGDWFVQQLHGHLSRKYGTKSSGEGCSGSWKNDPDKYPVFENWLRAERSGACKMLPGYISRILDIVPEPLRELRG